MAHFSWHDIIVIAIGLPALIAFMWLVKDEPPAPQAPRKGISFSTLLLLGSIWRSDR